MFTKERSNYSYNYSINSTVNHKCLPGNFRPNDFSCYVYVKIPVPAEFCAAEFG